MSYIYYCNSFFYEIGFLKINGEKGDIIPTNIISYYDVKDIKRANVEDLGTLHLEVFANGNIIVTHEGKFLTKNL